MIIYAVNIHTGGGKILLDELLIHEPFGKVMALFHDQRYELPSQVVTKYPSFAIKPHLYSRLKAEWQLAKFLKYNPGSFVLFFGNLPPLFVKPKKSALYLQNCFLLPSVRIETTSVKIFLRLLVEKLILRFRIYRVSEVWVQTGWMIDELKSFKNLKVLKKPFLPSLPKPFKTEKKYDFISVTSLAKHKKLAQLWDALKVIASQTKERIKVLVILDQISANTAVPSFSDSQVQVTIFFNVSREELFSLYQKSQVAVITSQYESFSLPIYEALHFGLKVICPNLSYTNDVRTKVIQYEANSAQDLAQKMVEVIQSSNLNPSKLNKH